MSWFNHNAAAIQALCSIAGLVIACFLVALTAWYVRLTREIARSSLEQVKHIREAARLSQVQSARALGSLALRLRVGLGDLDSEVPKHTPLRAFSSMTERDIDDLEALAREVDNRAIFSAGDAVGALRVLQQLIQEAKGTDERLGWRPTEEQRKSWKKAFEAANRSLQEIETACRGGDRHLTPL